MIVLLIFQCFSIKSHDVDAYHTFVDMVPCSRYNFLFSIPVTRLVVLGLRSVLRV